MARARLVADRRPADAGSRTLIVAALAEDAGSSTNPAVRDDTGRMLKLGVAVFAALALVGCTNTSAGHNSAPHNSAPHTSAPQTSGPQLGAAGCTPPSPIGQHVVQGTSSTASLYGLLMPTRPLPIRAKEDVKIVWRMTGRGPLRLSARDPHGATVRLQWGPEAHGGSNFNRPGDEWGAGYVFGSPGCWQLHAARGHASADVWLRVRA
jgi:hypothetical protein